MIWKEIIEQEKKNFFASLVLCTTVEGLDALKTEQLGKSGLISVWYKELAGLDVEWKKAIGPLITEYKLLVETSIGEIAAKLDTERINKELQQEVVDYSINVSTQFGHHNLIQKELARMYHIFTKFGFKVFDGEEITSKYKNFYSVNIPASHPATEIHDTLYLKQFDETGENLLLRTHTSNMQHMLISQLGPECRFVVPGKVFREEKVDATHDVAFWQIEGVSIRRWMTLAHFKYDLKLLLSEIFESDLEIRLRPGYFPFVEPWYEVDIDCRNDPKLFELSKRRGWLEVLWCGMIHPNVLRGAGVDPEQYAGYAFGLGLSRMVAIKYGVKDIRLLTNGDLRFVQSFV